MKASEFFYIEHWMKFAKPLKKNWAGVSSIVVSIIWMGVDARLK